jgi:hypothetical protein
MCQACFEADAMFRGYLLARPDERERLTPEEASYYGFRRDLMTNQWVDAWIDQIRNGQFRVDAIEPAAQ